MMSIPKMILLVILLWSLISAIRSRQLSMSLRPTNDLSQHETTWSDPVTKQTIKKKMWNKITKDSIKKQQAKTKQNKYSEKKVILYLKLCCHSSYLAGFAYFLQNVPYRYIYNKCMIAGEMYADVYIHATLSEIKVIVWLRPVFGKMNANFLFPVSYSPGTFFVAWFLDDRNFLPLPALTSACLQFPFHHSWFP